ncbi:MAG: exonuclease subunit SbcD [Candidatus Latescibacteria bacterium]|nr:exonuclease subunit SbcD [Candidatus Latescibacterota bacterium]
MEMRLLHFADLHLGIENYGTVDPATGLHSRVRDFIGALGRVFDLAIEEQVDLVLFAGDAYKNCDPTPTHQREFALQLRRLQQAAIPIVMVVGNHDTPVAFGRATSMDIFSALEMDHTYVIRRPQILQVPTRSGPLQVAGLPWPTRHMLRTLDEYKDLPQESITDKIEEICTVQIEEFARQLDPALPAVFSAHIAAAEATYSGSERTAVIGQDPTLLTSVLAQTAFDYVALGHVHKYQDLHPDAHPPVVYSGSLERITFGEEHDDKGCCLVTIEYAAQPAPHPRQTTSRFVPVPVRPFVTIEVEVDPEEDPTRLILEAIAARDIAGAVVRVIYTLTGAGANDADLEAIHRALEPASHVASIQPRFAPVQRERRSAITEDLGLRDALDRYVDNRPDLDPHRAQLQSYAQQLEHELDPVAPPEEAA